MQYREWSPAEIATLIKGAETCKRSRGVDWAAVSKLVGTRTPRQCQDRYFARTKNGVVTKTANVYSVWTADEEQLLRDLVQAHGHKWTMFVDYFPGRDAGKIKAKYYNGQRQSHGQADQGSSYDSSFVEQQRSCVSWQDQRDFTSPGDDEFWSGDFGGLGNDE